MDRLTHVVRQCSIAGCTGLNSSMDPGHWRMRSLSPSTDAFVSAAGAAICVLDRVVCYWSVDHLGSSAKYRNGAQQPHVNGCFATFRGGVSSEWRFAEKRLGYQLAEVTGLVVRQDISGVRGVMHECYGICASRSPRVSRASPLSAPRLRPRASRHVRTITPQTPSYCVSARPFQPVLFVSSLPVRPSASLTFSETRRPSSYLLAWFGEGPWKFRTLSSALLYLIARS